MIRTCLSSLQQQKPLRSWWALETKKRNSGKQLTAIQSLVMINLETYGVEVPGQLRCRVVVWYASELNSAPLAFFSGSSVVCASVLDTSSCVSYCLCCAGNPSNIH